MKSLRNSKEIFVYVRNLYMSRSSKVRLLGILAFALVSINVFWLRPFSSIWAHKTQNASSTKQHHLCPTTNMPMVPTQCRAALFWDLTVNPTCFMALGATAWSTTVKGMDFLMPNILRIWALARIHPAERFGMPTLSDFHLARATGSMDNLPNSVLPLSIKVS